MKRTIAIFIGLGIMLSFGGCANQQNINTTDTITQTSSTPEPTTSPATPSPTIKDDEQINIKATVAGIRLGDSADILEKKFGTVIKEIPLEQPNYYGKTVSQVEYNNGVSAFIDKDSNTILEISVEAGDYETNLGLKLEDSADDVLRKYSTEYKLFKGDNSDDYLKGWYIVEEGELLIFDFKKDDGTHYNESINNSDRVVSITLSHPMYFD
jgi:hypothetical protein